jgi:hypothetical protein
MKSKVNDILRQSFQTEFNNARKIREQEELQKPFSTLLVFGSVMQICNN